MREAERLGERELRSRPLRGAALLPPLWLSSLRLSGLPRLSPLLSWMRLSELLRLPPLFSWHCLARLSRRSQLSQLHVSGRLWTESVPLGTDSPYLHVAGLLPFSLSFCFLSSGLRLERPHRGGLATMLLVYLRSLFISLGSRLCSGVSAFPLLSPLLRFSIPLVAWGFFLLSVMYSVTKKKTK